PASRFVACKLVTENPAFLGQWLENFRPLRHALLGPLAEVFRNRKRPETERILAASLLADYAADQPALIVELLKEADDRQYAVLLPVLRGHRDQAQALLEQELVRGRPSETSGAENDALAKRQARSAVALLQLGRSEPVWPLLRHQPDTALRTYLVQ